MFRPTHFVILFAVVLCANAYPATPDAPAPDTGKSATLLEPGALTQSATVSDTAVAPAKGDLDTDATVHFGYGYYGPRWGYYGPGWGARSYYGPYNWW